MTDTDRCGGGTQLLRQLLVDAGMRRGELMVQSEQVVEYTTGLIRQSMDAGISVTRIAKDLGISRALVYKLIRESE